MDASLDGVAWSAAVGTTSSLFSSSSTPSIVTAVDFSSIELGVKFRSLQDGAITAIRFYKGPANTGTHTANLWNATGTSLATATFSGETASGWQQVNLSTNVAITASTIYVASYHTEGNYSADSHYFDTDHTNGPLTAPDTGSSGGNGVYTYDSASVFPTNTYNATNYWVDVVFTGAFSSSALAASSSSAGVTWPVAGAFSSGSMTGSVLDGDLSGIIWTASGDFNPGVLGADSALAGVSLAAIGAFNGGAAYADSALSGVTWSAGWEFIGGTLYVAVPIEDSEFRRYVVAAEDRRYAVAAEDRHYAIPPEDRKYSVPKEDRKYEVTSR